MQTLTPGGAAGSPDSASGPESRLVCAPGLGSWTVRTSLGHPGVLTPLVKNPTPHYAPPGELSSGTYHLCNSLAWDANPNLIMKKHQTQKKTRSIFKRGEGLHSPKISMSQKSKRDGGTVQEQRRLKRHDTQCTTRPEFRVGGENAITDTDDSTHKTEKCTG